MPHVAPVDLAQRIARKRSVEELGHAPGQVLAPPPTSPTRKRRRCALGLVPERRRRHRCPRTPARDRATCRSAYAAAAVLGGVVATEEPWALI